MLVYGIHMHARREKFVSELALIQRTLHAWLDTDCGAITAVHCIWAASDEIVSSPTGTETGIVLMQLHIILDLSDGHNLVAFGLIYTL
jgi:hypothetical protein